MLCSIVLLTAARLVHGSLIHPSPAKAALRILTEQADCGAPLDVLLQRHVRAHKLTQQERVAVSDCLFAVARQQGRLDARLHAAGVEHPDPRARLLASLALSGDDVTAGGGWEVTAGERRWLDALGPAPLEAEGNAARTPSKPLRAYVCLPLNDDPYSSPAGRR